MSGNCYIQNGKRYFPENIACRLLEGYTNTSPEIRRGINRNIVINYGSIKAKLFLNTKEDRQIFYAWFVEELEYGAKEFYLKGNNFFGYDTEVKAKFKNNNFVESLVNSNVAEIDIEFELLEPFELNLKC